MLLFLPRLTTALSIDIDYYYLHFPVETQYLRLPSNWILEQGQTNTSQSVFQKHADTVLFDRKLIKPNSHPKGIVIPFLQAP